MAFAICAIYAENWMQSSAIWLWDSRCLLSAGPEEESNWVHATDMHQPWTVLIQYWHCNVDLRRGLSEPCPDWPFISIPAFFGWPTGPSWLQFYSNLCSVNANLTGNDLFIFIHINERDTQDMHEIYLKEYCCTSVPSWAVLMTSSLSSPGCREC